LIYRDIFDEIYQNINLEIDKNDSLLTRMNFYINKYKTNNSECKIKVIHKFKNNLNVETFICGEIDLINNKTIIDFKCSESDFKLEWLIQLLLYYSLYKDSEINHLMIINIMDGKEYFFDIESSFNKQNLINYLEGIINKDQQSIRNYPDLNYISIDKLQLNININKNNDYKINFNKKNINNTLIFDTETSGFDDIDIIQIAYIIINENNNIIKKQNYYIKDRISSIKAQKIHNITVDKLRKIGKDFFDVMNEFIMDLQNVNTIVGHNLDFDIRVVLNNLRKYDIKIIVNNNEEYELFKYFIIYDTYKKSKVTLNKLYFDLFNDNINNAHDALSDVEATLKCYLELIK
jgi:DNA polymerase-3 subunit epsilon